MWNTLVACLLYACVVDGCRFGPAPNCGFACRCTGTNQCDSETGECAPGSQCQSVPPIGYGWKGEGCLVGNVAYGKLGVIQSGTYNFYVANLAVDGNTHPYVSSKGNESCAHPLSSNRWAWWMVDLEDIYNIQNITIVNRLAYPDTAQPQDMFNEKSTNYDIKIGNTLDRSQQALCFHQNKPGDDIQPIESFVCDNGDMEGRYVSFTRTGGTKPNEATICEFIVVGYKVVECHPDACNERCNPMKGCDTCVAGKMLPDCQQDCPDGYWGVNCAYVCGMCYDSVVCDKVTGLCGEKCEGWYIPELCSEELRRPTLINARVTHIASDFATISWERPTGFSVDIRQYFFYTVKHGKKTVSEEQWEVSDKMYLSSGTGHFQYTLAGLDYNTEYNVKFQAHRELNGQSVIGTAQTSSFTTLCKAPDVPPTPSYIGTPGTFTVMWDSVENLSSGCEVITSLEITITCENNTQTTVNRTWNLPLTNTGFNYAAETAVSCDVTLTITNNMGLSSSSFDVEVTTTTTVLPTSGRVNTVTKIVSPLHPIFQSTQSSSYPTTIKVVEKQPNIGQDSSPPSIAAIAGGAAGGVVLLVLIVVVVVIAVRRRHGDRNTPTNASDSTKPTPVYQNTKPTGAEYYNAGFDVTQATEYAAIDDNQVAKKTGTPGKGKLDIYENMKGTGPQYESLEEVKDQNISPVYQALA